VSLGNVDRKLGKEKGTIRRQEIGSE